MERYSTSNPHPTEVGLPTLSKLGDPQVPSDLDVKAIASTWLEAFGSSASGANVDGVLDTMVKSSFTSGMFNDETPSPDGTIPVFWRDFLAFTWDFRTLEGTPNIRKMLEAQLEATKAANFKLGEANLEKPFPDLTFISLFFTFETGVGLSSGIVSLVPLSISATQPKSSIPGLNTGDITWRAFVIFTNLEDLKGFPESIGSRRNHLPNHGKWEEQRRTEMAFEGRDPTVLIIGGGQSGLTVAARLKALGIDSLILEKHKRVGDNWRTRYDALCLHDPVWFDHLPYLPFPPTWPVYTPAKKLANWLESYAEALELNVWTSATVLSATQDPTTKIWSTKVQKEDGSIRIFKTKYVVIAFGLKGGTAFVPQYPGMDKFKGITLHSSEHNTAKDHLQKRVVVIGAGTSAHDICADYADFGVDVTMFQRSSTYVTKPSLGVTKNGSLFSENGPPTDVADRLLASRPRTIVAGLGYRFAKLGAERDKEILDGLQSAGFKLNMGLKDTGMLLLAPGKASGYYIDVGASQQIVDKKIKIKSGTQIKEITENGLKFDDGSEISADVIVFCTGYTGSRHSTRAIFGDEVAENTEMWGFDEEGEMKGLFKENNYTGLYGMMGNLAYCRFHSKHVALQIKALEEGLFDGMRYSIPRAQSN